MNKKRVIIHIITPIVLSIISYFISISFIFKIPDPSGVGYVPETYLFAFILAMFVLGVSAIVSAILYVGRKRNGVFQTNGEEVVIDGTCNIEYVPLCGECYLKKVKKINFKKVKGEIQGENRN